MLVLCTTDSMIWNFLVPHIKRFEREGCIVHCAASVTGSYFEELQNMGLIMHEIPFKRSPYHLQNFKAYKLLCSLVKMEEYDMIFCHEPVGGAFGRIVGRKFGCKVVYMAHGFHFYKGAPIINNMVYFPVEKFLSRWTDLLITINHEDYEASKKFNAKNILHVNGIGVDTSRFQAREAHYFEKHFNLSKDSIKLLSVGELIERKNHVTIIETMKSFRNQNVHYFIAGEGELMDVLKHRVLEYGLEHQIHFLGFCRNISELCNSCDIFVFPSLQEGLSLALMEAMSCEKAVIASRIRGNIDLIEDKKGGLLIDTYNVSAYKEAICTLINNKKMETEMGIVNKNNVLKYDIKAIEEILVNNLLKK